MNTIVELLGVGRRYGTVVPLDALRSVDLRIGEGEWVGVVGPSGSGKSTLLNVIGCLDQATSGTYRLVGVDTSDLRDKQRTELRALHIGFVFQSFHLLSHRTVVENVMLGEVYRGLERRGRRDRALASLDRVGLRGRGDDVPSILSGGQRQRVAIARAITGEPDLLLCDEPTGNLDTGTTETILDLLRDLHRQGLTIVSITHSDEVAAAAERTIRIVDGSIVSDAANEPARARQ
ncbi:MAG: putative ABC transport system ATP-binding protein [Candidatus Poriferisodalaceae bacterium]|jgi:putative ABC transport system ATP-binding protein